MSRDRDMGSDLDPILFLFDCQMIMWPISLSESKRMEEFGQVCV